MPLRLLFILFALFQAVGQEKPAWQRVVMPTVEEAAQKFADPPAEYGLTLWWFWNGSMTDAVIRRDLDAMHQAGARAVLIWAYYGLTIEYLSPEWIQQVTFAVHEAKSRGMKVWLMDEGSYPSGFGGAKFTTDHPERRMQVLDTDGRPVYRTSPTRYANRPEFPKDGMYFLFDALNPKITRSFLESVHGLYEKAFGAEFGKTVLGFMGDEPSFPGVPWTEALPAEFQRQKGYDITPYLAKLASKQNDAALAPVRADYWDVWSRLYEENFFGEQARWCEARNLEYIVHICGEEDMRVLQKLNGDYFRAMRPVQIPGVDAIWRQIWPGEEGVYPKMGSSAAHHFGRPRSFTESFAVYGLGLSLAQAKWVFDQQLVRGINLLQAMEYQSDTSEFRRYFHPPDWASSPQWTHFPWLARYSNRLSYMLSVGTPAAEIALYYPGASGWLQNFQPERATLDVARQLLEAQRDFDFLDESALPALTLKGGALVNRSGQAYRSVIVAGTPAMSSAMLNLLDRFRRGGGQIIMLGGKPSTIYGQRFLDAKEAFPQGLNASVQGIRLDLTALPADVRVTPAAVQLRYLHRRLADGDLYFFFNEAPRPLRVNVRFTGKGYPERWDAETGNREPLRSENQSLDLDFEPSGTQLIVLSPRRPKQTTPGIREFQAVSTLEGEWQFELAGKRFSSVLTTWDRLGHPEYFGSVTYQKSFDWAGQPDGMFLDLGEVGYSAEVRLNGRDLGSRAWPPFRWDLAAALVKGANQLEVKVFSTRANDLSGNPARLAELEARGWMKNSYWRTYAKSDAEMVPAGLQGPVRLLRLEAQGPATNRTRSSQ